MIMLFISLIIAVLVCLILCGATPDNANLFICFFASVAEIVAVIGLDIFNISSKEKKGPSIPVKIITVLPIMLLTTVVLSCYSKVNTGNTGILITFGKVEPQTYQAGIVWRFPWQQLVQMDNRVQINDRDDKPMQLKAFSKDNQEVAIAYTVNYRVNSQNASKLYQEVGPNYFGVALAPIIQESVKNECAKFSAQELIENRPKFALGIEEDMKPKFENYYIELVATSIEDLDFSDAYTNAVEAKQVALQEKLKAEQEAEKLKVEADAKAYKVVTEAKAEAEANMLKQKSITRELIDYEKVTKWNGKLPTIEGSSTPIIDFRDVK